MDVPHIQRAAGLRAGNTASQAAKSRPLKPPDLTQESARWPLQAVDDNTAAARHLTSSQSRHKTPRELEVFGHPSTTLERSVPATYHAPLRPRRGLDDPPFSRDPSARSFEEDQLAHERRARSYRDTTSEIISLYASRNVTSHNSTLCRNDDDASSTTPHARVPTSQRHTQSNSTHLRNASWQKSRTPGPYPTRLRRPGTSITSPPMTEARGREYSRMVEGERGHQKVAHNLYKTSLANNQRRAPPLSLRAEMNRSSSSLPSRSSPGLNHYMTASGRARTPSSTVSWASRPSDRYYMGSIDQSSRSASLTSIVEMYQRPMTSSSTCPAMRPTGTLYYDYSEDFKDPDSEDIRQPVIPLSPIPYRAGGGTKPTILQQDLQLKMHGTIDNPHIQGSAYSGYRRGYSRTDSSIEDSFDSYLQGSHDDSIEEIERAIANAISNAAADKLVAASEHLTAYTDACRNRREDSQTKTTNVANMSRRLPATERQYGLKTAAPNLEMNINARRASQLSLNKNFMALDPAFADFTSLLSSFERLAKSPFSRLSDEDDVDERHSRRSSKLSTMDTLDEMESMENPHLKRHQRNVATAQVGTPALSSCESPTEHPLSSGEGALILTPEPLSPRRDKGFNEPHLRFMKALPPLPAEIPSTHLTHANQNSSNKQAQNAGAISQARSLSLRSHISRSGSPGKLKLRVRTPSSSGDNDFACVSDGAKRERRSADECRPATSSRPPPKLKLKISRNQLGQGRNAQTESVIRNNRLKQCNALADVAQPPRNDVEKRIEKRKDEARSKGPNEKQEPLVTNVDPRESRVGSCQSSDQFNLSYPPTSVESVDVMLPRLEPFRESVEEVRAVQPETSETAARRIKPKFSLLRLRPANHAGPATLTKPAPCHACTQSEPEAKTVDKNIIVASTSQFDSTVTENRVGSVSVKSERVGNRVKRWATDAKRVVRSYVRRTLIRTPKSAKV
ncbi:hypothetical protein CCM_01568 [Cordyceps militaris CM01]|uniref:Uncharacterized protein n=1 Tax=Cordyceps militaris (strain CM01) TaxID=983644 RepID=G3J5V8_CORMM|nr:uncharacterized protein CCM_01568 [Cordyceps militaris CM01]EGX96910.1 hypothetical protein CCM_01568 [Cordyceps militaris CM01]